MVAHHSCELANPAQMCQIASQTGVLLRQMRFVAGRGAVATEMLAGAPWWKAIGKMLLAGAPWWLSCCWPGGATEQDAAGRGADAALRKPMGVQRGKSLLPRCKKILTATAVGKKIPTSSGGGG